MNAFRAVLKRDLKLALRSNGAWMQGLLFFVLFISVCGIALGGASSALAPLAPALIWLAVILSMLLSFETLFSGDASDGTLEQYKLSGSGFMPYVFAKCAAQWILSILPMLCALPLVGLLLGLSGVILTAIALSIFLASPALIIYGAFSAACLIGNRASGLLMVLLSLPILIPLLIFGIDSVNNSPQVGLFTVELEALIGISLISIAVGVPAIIATLKIYTE